VDLELASSMLAIRAGDFAAADERLRRLLREGGRDQRAEAAWYLTLSLRNQGRLREALPVASGAISRIADATVLFEMGRARDAVRVYDAMLPWTAVEFPGHQAKHQTWMMTHIAAGLAALGDTARLPVLADSAEQLGQGSAYGRDPRLHHFIRGLLWNARGKPDLAVNEFRASVWSWTDGYTRANYELARTLLALNRPSEALYPLQSAFRGDLEAGNLYVTRTELHELLANVFDRLNQPDSAAVHYRAVVNAWFRADPQFTPRLRAAQQRLGALQPTRKASEN
jgi:tetratricopeptide (TPR) repeat protein